MADDLELERLTLHLINQTAYGSSSRVHSRRLREVTDIDLPPSDIRVLEFLAGHPPLAVSVLASELGIDLAQASRQATALEAAGHVVRRSDPADRRRTLVALSPTTLELMDKWLLDWSSGYVAAVNEWEQTEIEDLTTWFQLVLHKLDTALPRGLDSPLPDRWAALVPEESQDAVLREFLGTLILLLSWVGQSAGFNALLAWLKAPIRQHGYFTLRVVSHHGPLSVAEVAERMAIDPSQASKRLRQLTDLGLVDRAVDAFDRRSSLVRVSRKGAALERKVRDRQLETFIGILGPIDARRRERWTEQMRRYVDELTEAATRTNRWAGLVAEAG